MKKFAVIIVALCCGFLWSEGQTMSNEISFFNKITNKDLPPNDNFRHSELISDARDIEKEGQLINLIYERNKNIIRLNDNELVEDDAAGTGPPEKLSGTFLDKAPKDGVGGWVEFLSKNVVAKKILVVDEPRVASARIVFKASEEKGNKIPLNISLNGKKIVREASIVGYPDATQYSAYVWSRWYYVDLPVENLVKGPNEILMWTDSDKKSWGLYISGAEEFERGSLTKRSPNHSMKSRDGGKTWNDTKLGSGDLLDGEYNVRISLDHFLSEGTYVSPVIDLVDGENVLKSNVSGIRTGIIPELDKPERTDIKISVRFSDNPVIGAWWGDWEPLDAGRKYQLDNKRYMQWKAVLKTTDPLRTPILRGIRFTTQWEDNSPNKSTGLSGQVINNGKMITPSYAFQYENLNLPELKKFRESNNLDNIVSGAKSEFDTMMRLLNWAYRVPVSNNSYSWNWSDALDAANALRLQDEGSYKHRRRDAMCLFSTQALIGALISMGYQARHINIASEAMSGHEITEVWSNEFNKWIYLDPTIESYYYDSNTGEPLNTLELHNLLVKEMPRIETWKRPFVTEMGRELVSKMKVGKRQGDNQYAIETTGDFSDNKGIWALQTMGYLRMIPRNNFLSQPVPVPPAQGTSAWGWNGYLNWYDSIFIKRDEFQRYTDRMTDFYQPLNQAKLYLNETTAPGILNVLIDNFTPGGLDGFLVRIDKGRWVFQKSANVNWDLKSGLNTLEVRVRNARKILGPVSKVQVSYFP